MTAHADPDRAFASPGTTPGAPDPPMLIRAAAAHGFVRTNPAFQRLVGYGDEELAVKPLVEWIDARHQALVQVALEQGTGHCRTLHQTRDGEPVQVDVVVANHDEGLLVLVTGVPDESIPEPEAPLADEGSVRGTLDTIARIMEDQNPGYRCSILLVADGRFVAGAGPSLPDDYNDAIDGENVGPAVGSCGTAIYWNVPVIVADIQRDPLWRRLAGLAAEAGVASCWSHPFTCTSGNVLGALALYGSHPHSPTVEQLGRLRAAARMTGLAVERGKAEEGFRQQRERELELEDQLRQAAKMEALGVLAGGVAHDFNNVLATILANADLATELLPPDSEIAPLLGEIAAASRRAGAFCQQMLAYAGRGSLKISQIEIGSLLAELRRLVQPALSKKATIEWVLHPDPIHVEGDDNQLLQVTMNIVTNASEALGDREGVIIVRSEVVQLDEKAIDRLEPGGGLVAGEFLRLSVRDSGSGMDAETIARSFDPFFTTKFTGRGLGLSAVKGIIARHRGAIQVESRVGEGTTFTVLLPKVPEPEVAAPPASVIRPMVSYKRVLVVDDEKPLRNVLARRLKLSGYDVVEAADGQEAIDIFRADPYAIDCVLLDLSMPRLDGRQVHDQLVLVRADVPVIVMSGFSEGEVLDRFAGVTLAAVIQKPIPADILLRALQSAME